MHNELCATDKLQKLVDHLADLMADNSDPWSIEFVDSIPGPIELLNRATDRWIEISESELAQPTHVLRSIIQRRLLVEWDERFSNEAIDELMTSFPELLTMAKKEWLILQIVRRARSLEGRKA